MAEGIKSLHEIGFYHPVALEPQIKEQGRKRVMASFAGKAWELMAVLLLDKSKQS